MEAFALEPVSRQLHLDAHRLAPDACEWHTTKDTAQVCTRCGRIIGDGYQIGLFVLPQQQPRLS